MLRQKASVDNCGKLILENSICTTFEDKVPSTASLRRTVIGFEIDESKRVTSN
jgi:hypothetical protein